MSEENTETNQTLSEELQCLTKFKKWVETESKFNGRQDDDFLYMFIRSCDYDVELSKVTYSKYYDSIRKYPEWFANRDIMANELYSLLEHKISTQTNTVNNKHQPTVIFSQFSRLDPSVDISKYLKLFGIITEYLMQCQGAQFVGLVWVVDCQNYHWRLVTNLLNPIFVKNFINAFHLSMPLRIKAIILLNAPSIAAGIYNLATPFMNEDLKNKLHVTTRDRSILFENVPIDSIPEEYGGNAGKFDHLWEIFASKMVKFDYSKNNDDEHS
ncbi:hypothetical protein CHUAL_014029 [Chamberlinius hualienensis]